MSLHNKIKTMRKLTTLLLCSLFWLSATNFQTYASGSGSTTVLPGDSNCDGEIDVMDVITTANYIIGANPQPFCFENADVNSDGIVDLGGDLIGTINIIHDNFVCRVSTVTDNDGNIYNTMQIGDQCWMKENLRTTNNQPI